MKLVVMGLVVMLFALITTADAGEISPVQKSDSIQKTCVQKSDCVQKTAVQKTATQKSTQKSVVPGDGTIPLKYKLTLRSRIELRREARAKIRGIRIQTGRVNICIGCG